jgi:hypothetical protein
MPEVAKWVNGHRYDGGRLSPQQKELRAFYGRLLKTCGEPAFADGEFFPLNGANKDNGAFGRLGGHVAVDQRVRELPLEARDLNAIALDLRNGRVRPAQLLALHDELGNPESERLHGVPVAGPLEVGSAHGPMGWAASHELPIGADASEVKPHPGTG